MDRENYLNRFWTPYPAAPTPCQARGRLLSITSLLEDLVELEIESNFQIQKLRVPNQEPVRMLRPGDLVAISEGAVILLAPKVRDEKPSTQANQALWTHMTNWNFFLAQFRLFFLNRGFLEVNTPSLVICPGTEPSLEVFETIQVNGVRSRKMYLPTSPEIYLKKTLSRGFEKIFEITKSYRNNEITDRHQPEFWILEWYRAYAGVLSLQQDVCELVDHLVKRCPGKLNSPKITRRKTVSQLFEEKFGFRLYPDSSEEELRNLAKKYHVDVHAAKSIDDVFFLLFYEIEQEMNPDELLFVEDYPPYQAALARINSEGWAERFEVYWQGFELANAFHELNDPKLQRARSFKDRETKRQAGHADVELDEEFFAALESGMPPSSGIALGLERFFMAFYGIPRIQDLRLFPAKHLV